MKGKTALKLAGLLLVLTFATSPLVAGTYAKYVTELDATGTLIVAKWKAEFGAYDTVEKEYTVDLVMTIDENDAVDGDLLAPGTTGTFALVYDTEDTQVAHKVTIEMEIDDLHGLPIKFYKDNAGAVGAEIAIGTAEVEIWNVTYGPTEGTEETVTIHWAWALETVDEGAEGGNLNELETDFASGSDLELTVNVSFKAVQLSAAEYTP